MVSGQLVTKQIHDVQDIHEVSMQVFAHTIIHDSTEQLHFCDLISDTVSTMLIWTGITHYKVRFI